MSNFRRSFDITYITLLLISSAFFFIINFWLKGSLFGFAIGSFTSFLLFKITWILNSFNLKKRKILIIAHILKMLIFFIILSLIMYLIVSINKISNQSTKSLLEVNFIDAQINLAIFFVGLLSSLASIIFTSIYLKRKKEV
ncbi:hypothetical protein [Mycoplasma sp. OR1901]|uniref:hypothetical protein n=1 Tax=Mycoplasma sp. OR1901 TaxID=2742195 RepID=UPI001582F6B4|nr:hypothetical protein [Mycoplasma sp. OR1901]QKT05517.1 hypothetical protein HTZ87_02265 [Mycoplasma sp. OR1901]